jgi:alpha-D-ribose 1-methylphosphonate 5-triphosphate synthase subunit PhnG
MMHPDRMPSVSLGIIVPVGASYDPSHHWPNDAGVVRASVRFDAGGYSYGHIQGEPAALRELAAALLDAADRADPAVPAAALAEGVAR